MRDSAWGLLIASIGLASAVGFVLGGPTRGNMVRLFRGMRPDRDGRSASDREG